MKTECPDAPFTALLTSSPKPEQQRVAGAFAAGAAGILISREYDEMRVESLKTIGETLTGHGKA